MKILILNWRSFKSNSAGGAEKVTLKHIQAWQKKGWHTTTLTGIKAWLSPFLYWFQFKGRYDIVIDQIHGLPFLTPLWAFRSQKIAFIHEIAGSIWDYMFPFPLNLVGRLAEKISFIFYRNIPFWTVSKSTAEDLIKMGIRKKQIAIITHGVDLKQIRKIPKKEKKLTLLYLGRVVKMKRIEEILKVLKAIKTQTKCRLIIAGNLKKNYFNKLNSLAKKLGLTKEVSFLGIVSKKRKVQLLQKAHFLINTSIKEGFGLNVLEANSQATPALVYNTAGLKNIVENGINGYKVKDGNYQALAEKILKAWKNKKVYKKLCTTSLKYAKRFSWKKAVKKSISLLLDTQKQSSQPT